MTVTPDSIRRNLSDLASDAASVGRSDEKLVEGAAHRREVVSARIDELRPTALTNQAAGDEYSALIEERGQLDLVLGGRS